MKKKLHQVKSARLLTLAPREVTHFRKNRMRFVWLRCCVAVDHLSICERSDKRNPCLSGSETGSNCARFVKSKVHPPALTVRGVNLRAYLHDRRSVCRRRVLASRHGRYMRRSTWCWFSPHGVRGWKCKYFNFRKSCGHLSAILRVCMFALIRLPFSATGLWYFVLLPSMVVGE